MAPPISARVRSFVAFSSRNAASELAQSLLEFPFASSAASLDARTSARDFVGSYLSASSVVFTAYLASPAPAREDFFARAVTIRREPPPGVVVDGGDDCAREDARDGGEARETTARDATDATRIVRNASASARRRRVGWV